MTPTEDVYLFRVSTLEFALRAADLAKVQKVADPAKLTIEALAKNRILNLSDALGMLESGFGGYVIRPRVESDFRGVLVDAVKAKQAAAILEDKTPGLVVGRVRIGADTYPLFSMEMLTAAELPAADVVRINMELEMPSRQPDQNRQERNTRKVKRSAARQQRRRRVIKRLRNVWTSYWESLGSKIALFLVGLIGISILGILFFEPGANDQFKSWWDTFWFAIVTITTVGYGDKAPVTVGGRIVGLFLMGMGVVVVAAITGQIASFFVDQQMKRRGGLARVSGLRNHFVVCGWRKELDRVLLGILAVNPDMDPSALVVVNSVEPDRMQAILEHPALKGIRYVNGDYIEEETLRRANIVQAARVLVLADFSQDYSAQEVDSRTVMSVLTIESLTKRIYVSAELLDQRFERYLRLANCDEVVLSREYSKLILANASSASGVSHVIEDLLSVEENRGLKTRDIPDTFVGDTFGRLADHFSETYGAIAIGLLENTGNFYKLKREALNEAQMTPDISKLVQNLKQVKQLEPNRSVLNPGREYRIKRNTRAIIIEKRSVEEGAA